MTMNKVTIEYEELPCVGELKTRPQTPMEKRTGVIIAPMPSMTEAQVRDSKGDPPTAIIETYCGFGNRECIYKDTCKLKEKLDDLIYEGLLDNMVIAPEIRWCGHYVPKNHISGQP